MLPPGQQLAAPGKWPSVGERLPPPWEGPWKVRIAGLVGRPAELALNDLRALPQVDVAVDIHCVTRWSMLGARFRGVRLVDVLEQARVAPEARFASFVAHSPRAHSTSLPLADALALGALVALEYDGRPLEELHGGPVRIVVPGRYFYKSVKWLVGIDLLAEDRLGHWEAEAGYHNTADPWLEQRYIAGRLTKQEAAALIAGRDFSGRELLGIEAAGRDLVGLRAHGAILRNADFRGTRLRDAAFDGANLTNARFQGADLRGASFRGAGLDGADLRGADLRSADLTGATLTAATFRGDQRDGGGLAPALLDATTRIDRGSLAELTAGEEAYVLARLAIGQP
jgi:hypothetical protein